MNKRNILLLGVGGNVTQGIIAALNEDREQYNLIGACISEESIGLYMCDEALISPYVKDENFLSWLIKICNKKKIDIILTGVEEIIFKIAENIEVLKEKTNSMFISSDFEKLKIGNDKLKTCIWLQENGLNFPKFANGEKLEEIEQLIKEVGFPILAKPKNGKGSQDIYIINSIEDINKIKNKNIYVFQEYLGNENEEYTVGCYSNKNSEVQEVIIMKRKLKYGTTFMAEIVQNEEVRNEAKKICELFNPKGPLNIQMRVHKGKAVAFELNVRFSGTTPFRAKWGYNDVKAMLKEYVYNQSIQGFLSPLKEAKGYRYFNELYIDLNMERNLKAYKEVINSQKNSEQNRIKI